MVNPRPHRYTARLTRRLLAILCLNLFLAAPSLVFGALLTSRYRTFDTQLAWNAAMSILWLAALHLSFRRPFWLHVALAPFYLMTVADLFLVYRFGSRLTSSYLTLAFTDLVETPHFLLTFGRDLVVPGLVLVALGLLCLPPLRAARTRSPGWLRAAAVAAVVAGYVGPFAVQARKMRVEQAIRDVAAHDFSSIGGSLAQIAVTVDHVRATSEHMAARRAFSHGATQTAPVDGEQLYVIVIGESARPDRWSLNGYERDTTPRLRETPGVVSFSNVVASADLTSFAVPSLLSLAPVADWTRVARERSVVSAFRDAGFETYWISTQEVSSWGGIIYQLAGEAENRTYLDRSLDDALVGETRRVLGAPSRARKILVVLQGRGNHFGTTPYPPSFRRYPETGGDRRINMGNTYDNGTLFTDSVLADLIELLRSRGSHAALFYQSDHGENLGDDGHTYGHGVGNAFDLRVAAFHWYSDSAAAALREKVAMARARSGARLGHVNFSHSVLDFAGIGASSLDLTKSVFSATFAEAPRQYLSHGSLRTFDRD